MSDICEFEDLNNDDCVNCFNGYPHSSECPREVAERKALRELVHKRAEENRKKAYDEGYQQGRADAIREVFAKIGQPNECLFDYTSACCYSISDCMNCPITIDEMKGAEQ